MWIVLFTVASGAAVSLSVAAILMQSSWQEIPRSFF